MIKVDRLREEVVSRGWSCIAADWHRLPKKFLTWNSPIISCVQGGEEALFMLRKLLSLVKELVDFSIINLSMLLQLLFLLLLLLELKIFARKGHRHWLRLWQRFRLWLKSYRLAWFSPHMVLFYVVYTTFGWNIHQTSPRLLLFDGQLGGDLIIHGDDSYLIALWNLNPLPYIVLFFHCGIVVCVKHLVGWLYQVWWRRRWRQFYGNALSDRLNGERFFATLCIGIRRLLRTSSGSHVGVVSHQDRHPGLPTDLSGVHTQVTVLERGFSGAETFEELYDVDLILEFLRALLEEALWSSLSQTTTATELKTRRKEVLAE